MFLMKIYVWLPVCIYEPGKKRTHDKQYIMHPMLFCACVCILCISCIYELNMVKARKSKTNYNMKQANDEILTMER